MATICAHLFGPNAKTVQCNKKPVTGKKYCEQHIKDDQTSKEYLSELRATLVSQLTLLEAKMFEIRLQIESKQREIASVDSELDSALKKDFGNGKGHFKLEHRATVSHTYLRLPDKRKRVDEVLDASDEETLRKEGGADDIGSESRSSDGSDAGSDLDDFVVPDSKCIDDIARDEKFKRVIARHRELRTLMEGLQTCSWFDMSLEAYVLGLQQNIDVAWKKLMSGTVDLLMKTPETSQFSASVL